MSHSYLQKKTWLLLNRKYIKKTKLIRVCIFKIILKQSPKCFTIVKTSLRGNDHSELTSWPKRHPVSWQYVYLSPYFQAMQLKLHSGSFIEQLHSSSITWSHCAIAWTKCSQEEKKKSPTDNRLPSCCLEAFIGCFSIECLPCLTLIAVKGLKRPCKASFGGFQHSALPSYNILSISIGYSVQRYRLPSPITLWTFCSGCNTFQSFG